VVCLHTRGTILVQVGFLNMTVMDCWEQLSAFCMVEQQSIIAVGQYSFASVIIFGLWTFSD
jgi:hypothetical protein